MLKRVTLTATKSKEKGVSLLFFFVSALFMALAQPQYAGWFSLFAYLGGQAALWMILLPLRRKSRFVWASLWFFFVQAFQLSWLVTFDYHGVYILIVYAVLCLGLAVQYGLLALFLKRPFTIFQAAKMAAFWTLMEWIRLMVFCGFAFNPLGLSLTGHKLSLQFASLVGIIGLSFWTVFVNALGFRAMLRKQLRSFGLWAFVALFPFCYGFFHLGYHYKRMKQAPQLKVALVQTALRPEQKNLWLNKMQAFLSPYQQWEKILSYLPVGEEQLDMIILPECAVPYLGYEPIYQFDKVNKIFMDKFGRAVQGHYPLYFPFIQQNRGGELLVNNAFFAKTLANYFSSDVIIGLDDVDMAKEESYNAAFYFGNKSSKGFRYEKQILVPLGEYLPLAFLRPLVARYGITDFFTCGKESKVFQGKVPLSISICYEECFSHIIRKGREAGAELLVNITNDAYYPNSKLPEVHFELGKVRAIENGAPLLRSCNTGITACVDSLGNVTKFQDEKGRSEWLQGALIANISRYHYQSGFLFWGNYLCLGSSLIISLVSGILWLRTRKSFLSKEKKLKIWKE